MPRLALPPRADWIFALRTAVTGLAALFIASALGLEQPQWAMMTVFIVSQPVAGMVLAKGFFRLVGTLVGALAAIGIAAAAGDSPILFVVMLALWIGLCTFVSSMLRNPESYGAALAGYTAAIIGLPAFGHPHLFVELAVARCAEIMLGIVLAGLAGRFVLPQLARDALVERLAACIVDLARYAAAAIHQAGRAELDAMYAALIADTQALAAMRAYARLEAPGLVTHGRQMRHTIGYLLAAMSAARTLQARAAHPSSAIQPFRRSLDAILTDLAERPEALLEIRPSLRRIDELTARAQQSLDAPAVEDEDYVGVTARLTILTELLGALKATLRGLSALRLRSPDRVAPQALPALTIHRDHRAALTNAVRAAVASLCVTAFWMATRWADAAGVAVIVAVVSSLFASMPDPMQSAWSFFRGTFIAAPFAFLVGQLLLPALPGFGWFVLLVAPVLVGAGLAMANPRLTSIATAFAINFVLFLNPHAAMAYAPQAFLGSTAAILIGILLSMGVFAVVLPQRPRETMLRLVEAMHGDLMRLSLHERIPKPSAFESLAYDRVNQLMPLVQQRGEAGKVLLDGAIASVMLGLEILRLRRAERAGALPAAAGQVLADGLTGVARLIQARPRDTRPALALVAALREAAGRIGVPTAAPAVLQVAASLRLIAAVIEDHPRFFTREAVASPA